MSRLLDLKDRNKKNNTAQPRFNQAAKSPKSPWKKRLRLLAGTTVAIASTPYFLNIGLSHHSKDVITNSISDMTAQQQYTCPTFLESTIIQSTSADRINDLAKNLYSNKKHGAANILEHYKGGLNRIKSTFSTTAIDTRSDLNETARLIKGLSNMGINLCFDDTLQSHNLGSAYTPSLSLITINPNLNDQKLALHLDRHFARLHGKALLPFQALQDANLSLQDQKRYLDEILTGDTFILNIESNPNTDSFQQTETSLYSVPTQPKTPL